mmetsp:Transcript_29129/g.78131  ORF Transcript_29129/g.78131 Transcript_29129/m.78131 type:complete len:272 (-) Transcript_29129:117-932(-)
MHDKNKGREHELEARGEVSWDSGIGLGLEVQVPAKVKHLAGLARRHSRRRRCGRWAGGIRRWQRNDATRQVRRVLGPVTPVLVVYRVRRHILLLRHLDPVSQLGRIVGVEVLGCRTHGLDERKEAHVGLLQYGRQLYRERIASTADGGAAGAERVRRNLVLLVEARDEERRHDPYAGIMVGKLARYAARVDAPQRDDASLDGLLVVDIQVLDELLILRERHLLGLHSCRFGPAGHCESKILSCAPVGRPSPPPVLSTVSRRAYRKAPALSC